MTVINKLKESRSTIVILLWALVFAWMYTWDFAKPVKSVQHQIKGRTLEEIMATPVDNSAEPEWDKDFKSTINPVSK